MKGFIDAGVKSKDARERLLQAYDAIALHEMFDAVDKGDFAELSQKFRKRKRSKHITEISSSFKSRCPMPPKAAPRPNRDTLGSDDVFEQDDNFGFGSTTDGGHGDPYDYECILC